MYVDSSGDVTRLVRKNDIVASISVQLLTFLPRSVGHSTTYMQTETVSLYARTNDAAHRMKGPALLNIIDRTELT